MRPVSKQTLRRLPLYLTYLKAMPPDGSGNISSSNLAKALGLGEVQVRKDLAAVSTGGRPKLGYRLDRLTRDIESFLGFDNEKDAVLVGVGRLGQSLLCHTGFQEYGLNIVAAFDSAEAVIGSSVGGKRVFAAEKLPDLCRRMKIRIGIIAVSSGSAQSVCDSLVNSGIQAIWNFTPVRLNAPDEILVENEEMAASLARLLKRLKERSGG